MTAFKTDIEGNKLVWFGTKDKMSWVPAPQSGVTVAPTYWQAGGTFLNGGGWADNSGTSHEELKLAWGLMGLDESLPLLDVLRSPGPFYYLDPVIAGANCLPQYAAEWTKDNPFGATRVVSPVDDPDGELGPMLKSYAAQYKKDTIVWDFPVPPGFVLHFGWCGSGVVSVNGMAINPWWKGKSSYLSSMHGGGVHYYIQASGGAKVTNMTAVIQLGDEDAPRRGATPGVGRSSLALAGPIQESQYSAVIDGSNLSVSADFREVGAWL